MELQYFSLREFKCRCGRSECDAADMREPFLRKLDKLREAWGHPLAVVSGARCSYWNKQVGGAKASQHLLGNAADIVMAPREAEAFAKLAQKVGMGGVAIGKNFVHVDDGPKRSLSYV